MFYGSSPICMLVFAYVYGVAPHPHIYSACTREESPALGGLRSEKKKKKLTIKSDGYN